MINFFSNKAKQRDVLVVGCSERQELGCRSLLEDHFSRVLFVANWAQALDCIRQDGITHIVERISLIQRQRGSLAGLSEENDKRFAPLKTELSRLDFRLRKVVSDFKFSSAPPPPASDSDDPQPQYAVRSRQKVRLGK